jgi:pimeloyl-ACP methyl ester carboxylesterase
MLKKTLLIVAIVLVLVIALAVTLPYLLPEPDLKGRIPERPFADSRFGEVEGIRLHWRERLSNESPVMVVLLHGYGASSFSWRHSLDALERDGYRALAPDLPPFGYSERTAREPDWPALVIALVDRVAPESRLVLVGHSMGAGVATDVAARRPDRVDRLILVDGTPEIGRNSGPMGRLFALPPMAKAAEYWAARTLIKKSSVADMMESALGRPATETELNGYFLPLTIPGTYPTLLKRLSRRTAAENGWERVPLDIVWGENDRWVPLSAAEKLIETLPSRVQPEIIEGAAHNPMDTHPEAFNSILLERIARGSERWQSSGNGQGIRR